jgi:phosphate:Na+ symporter
MLGADVGTSLMAVVFSFDLSWLSPLLIFTGVVLFISRQATPVGRFGRVLIGLGLMLLALRLVGESTAVSCRRRRSRRCWPRWPATCCWRSRWARC